MKPVEADRTTAPTFKPQQTNQIWLNRKEDHKKDNYKTPDKFNVAKNPSPNGIDQQNKLSKGKWNSNSQNTIGNEQDKPSKSDKWNFYRENEDYFYWDSINNHVEKDKKDKTSMKVSLRINALESIMIFRK